MTRAYAHDELHDLLPGIECAARSGISLGPETSLRLAATVRDLQRELLTCVQRGAEARQSDAAAMEGLCARVRELEGHLRAVIGERLQGDNRAPQPALVAARAYLFPGAEAQRDVAQPGQVGAVVESRVPEEPATIGAPAGGRRS